MSKRTKALYKQTISPEFKKGINSLIVQNTVNIYNRNPKIIYLEAIIDADTNDILDNFEEFREALFQHLAQFSSEGIKSVITFVESEFLAYFEQLGFETKYKLYTAEYTMMIKEIG